ncbi:Oxidoreductase [Klebsiella pneumoniae]|nr:Oxidoreductase [Klebsiella pneumoniae]
MIADGLLGDIRIVNMQFAHGFHAQPVEQENASTRWRVDPRFVGPSYVLGDLATHPLFLVETMAPAAEDHPADVRQTKLRQKPRAAGR